MIAASASFTNCPAYAGTEASNRADGVDGVEDREALALADLAVDLAERRREVDDAGAVVDGHEVGDHHAVRVAVDRQDVERSLVVAPDELVDGDRTDDLGVGAEHRLDPIRGEHDGSRRRVVGPRT